MIMVWRCVKDLQAVEFGGLAFRGCDFGWDKGGRDIISVEDLSFQHSFFERQYPEGGWE